MKFVTQHSANVLFFCLFVVLTSTISTTSALTHRHQQSRGGSGIDSFIPRNSTADNLLFHKTSSEVVTTIYNSLYKDIILESQAVDIALVLDSSSNMGRDNFKTGRNFLAKLITSLPRSKFLNRSMRFGMITYSLSELGLKQFDFSWTNGRYRETVRRAIKKATYQGGYENHGTIALTWTDELLRNSSRSADTNTKKVIIFATSGYVTDKDALFGKHVDSWRWVSAYFRSKGVKVFMAAIGSQVHQPTIKAMASLPPTNYILPIANGSFSDAVITNLRQRIRRGSSSS